jgi:hypothetical protein
MTQTKTKTADAALEVSHLEGCPAERVETYEVEGPKGFVIVTRCIDCGAHRASKPTEEPTLRGKE